MQKHAKREEKRAPAPIHHQFNQQIEDFYKLLIHEKPNQDEKAYERKTIPELEIKFSTNGKTELSKIDYDRVVQKLKSMNFEPQSMTGVNMLRMTPEFLDYKSGSIKKSFIRVEITGENDIHRYCQTNDLRGTSFVLNEKSNRIHNRFYNSVINNDFNFKMDLRGETEVSANSNVGKNMISSWTSTKKTFRLINRVTYNRNDLPFKIELSIIKKQYKSNYTMQQADLFNSPESFEIEIEMLNHQCKYMNGKAPAIQTAARNGIQIVLGALQGSSYPISNTERRNVVKEYYEIINENNKDIDYGKMFRSSNFIGPSSVTLHLKNIIVPDENNLSPNIQQNYTVTDKADGDRCLLFISSELKIYLLTPMMDVIFTGCIVKDDEFVGSILDGEYIGNDKEGSFINSFYAFDMYFYKTQNIMSFPFFDIDTAFLSEDDRKYSTRYVFMIDLMEFLEPVSVVDNEIAPMRFSAKTFYPLNKDQDIFDGCKSINDKKEQGGFIYNIDGLIFTPMTLPVGCNKEKEKPPLKKTTWRHSFKWKPEKYNTIDFLVTTRKTDSGTDLVSNIFEEGMDPGSMVQTQKYKTIILRCGYNELTHGYINPCQDVLDDRLFQQKGRDHREEDYKPVQFYPTEPDDYNAGIANIMVKSSKNSEFIMMTEENELFEDNMVVEFSYNAQNAPGWRWNPLRVRYDKTAEYKTTGRKFGNDFDIANDNWHSIHYPVTEDMIFLQKNIPTSMETDENIYYNSQNVANNTSGLRDFHNLYVKKTLISSVARFPDSTLIDYACGKGGDLPKWIYAKLSFVLGIDISKDNLENRKNGACTRYLNEKRLHRRIPDCIFVNGNSGLGIRSGEAFTDTKTKLIIQSLFGKKTKPVSELGKLVTRLDGIAHDGFDISSCQFAVHYLFKNAPILHTFLRNVSECTRQGGYFIGTCYDGATLFNDMKDLVPDESLNIYSNGKSHKDTELDTVVWRVVKNYAQEEFNDDETCLGYEIPVFQESINKLAVEYLVNFNYLVYLMSFYGFTLISKQQAKSFGLPNGSGLFNELYVSMMNEISNRNNTEFRDAPKMKEYEKKISFLNRYFVFQKTDNVDAKQISDAFIYKSDKLEEILSPNIKELEETEKAMFDMEQKIISDKERLEEMPTIKPVIEPAIDLPEVIPEIENIPKKKRTLKAKKKLAIEEDIEHEKKEEKKKEKRKAKSEKEKPKIKYFKLDEPLSSDDENVPVPEVVPLAITAVVPEIKEKKPREKKEKKVKEPNPEKPKIKYFKLDESLSSDDENVPVPEVVLEKTEKKKLTRTKKIKE